MQRFMFYSNQFEVQEILRIIFAPRCNCFILVKNMNVPSSMRGFGSG